MKALIRKIASQKKIGMAIVVVFILLIAMASYILIGIQKNVQKMADVQDVTYFPDYPPINTEGKDAEMIKRGEYLAKAGDCMACHTNTPKKGPVFAGGLTMQTPFGAIYTPNITPDKETGIGNWTDEQFIKAMRQGISPQGHYYYPAFPYIYFNKISTPDLKALKAYLDSIPAVHQKNLDNDMVFPFNWRFLQLGWRLVFFYPDSNEDFQKDPTKSDEWNRAAYLTNTLGHCAMCHSPSYNLISDVLPLGAPIKKYSLTGNKIQGYLAPNITSANLSKVPDEQIVEVFTKDKYIGGGTIKGPMLEVNHDSLRYLTNEDLLGIARYLKDVHSLEPPRPKGGPGKGIYGMYCSGCHENGAGGAPKMGDAAAWDPLVKEGPEKVYENAINGIGGMPAKGTCLSCSDDEIKAAVDFMLAAVQGKKVVIIPKAKKLTIEDGQRIYDANCSVCHNSGFKNAPIPGNMEVWKPIIAKGFLDIYLDVITGRKGHPPHGACNECSDAELKAAVKYMLQKSSTTEDFKLW